MKHNDSSQPIDTEVRDRLLEALAVDEKRVLQTYLEIDPTTNERAAKSSIRLLKRDPDHRYGLRLHSTWMKIDDRLRVPTTSSPRALSLMRDLAEEVLKGRVDFEELDVLTELRDQAKAKRAEEEALDLMLAVEGHLKEYVEKRVRSYPSGEGTEYWHWPEYGLAAEWLMAHWPGKLTGHYYDRIYALVQKYGQEVLDKVRELFPLPKAPAL
jgi:hypothetical protein